MCEHLSREAPQVRVTSSFNGQSPASWVPRPGHRHILFRSLICFRLRSRAVTHCPPSAAQGSHDSQPPPHPIPQECFRGTREKTIPCDADRERHSLAWLTPTSPPLSENWWWALLWPPGDTSFQGYSEGVTIPSWHRSAEYLL